MKRKIFSIFLVILLMSVILCACVQEPVVFTLKYGASEGGNIQGEVEQTVEKGKDGTAVVAVADFGYEFVKWSDGVNTPFREDTNIQKNITVTAQFQKIAPTEFTVKYLSSAGGSIQGQTEQTVEQGKDAASVTAVADEGYEFVKWSDEVTTAERQDKAISKNITVTAIFKEIEKPEPLTKTYSLNYNFGEADSKPEQITFVENEQLDVTLPVPTREHFTFDGWYCDSEAAIKTSEKIPLTEGQLSNHFTYHTWNYETTQVADVDGNLLLSEEQLLEQDSNEIYAKWTANETFTYKILLVYVTRIEATLPNKDPNITEKVYVDYTMSELEREFCHLLTLRTKNFLDRMLDGMVDFQVDEYYTTETVTTKDFSTAVGDQRYSSLSVQKLEETADRVLQYDSALILYDAYPETTTYSGQAGSKYGEVRLDGYWQSIRVYKSSLEQVIEMLKNNEDLLLWGNIYLIDSYMLGVLIHELAHTIEQRMNLYSYHIHTNTYRAEGVFEMNRLYYLQEAVVDGEKVGIPYAFWKRDIAECKYYVTEDKYGSQGYVSSKRLGIYSVPAGTGNRILEAIYGEYVTVTAISSSGHRFLQWSDGVTTAERTDLITGDFTVTAIFEPITYTLSVVAGEGGKIVNGEGTWELQQYGQMVHIKAEADDGYRFVGWSDGVTDMQRTFYIQVFEIKLFDENDEYTLTAIFEKIE
ncbi:MAG: InlB B-repeat-containing protein [Corallococcus sp.]|nr:InlB B-repeat-containing protein [Corallococcus sp.]MCM1359473.1 InlB B-repeat-containing protein [Corallococcus sp.]MCM1394715.1 InlB B-repeat-containing protein [Corallococcus sp.]